MKLVSRKSYDYVKQDERNGELLCGMVDRRKGDKLHFTVQNANFPSDFLVKKFSANGEFPQIFWGTPGNLQKLSVY